MDAVTGAGLERPKKSRAKRMQARIGFLHQEVAHLRDLTETLLDHLEQAINPGLTDGARVRYRCMIQDIRDELRESREQQ